MRSLIPVLICFLFLTKLTSCQTVKDKTDEIVKKYTQFKINKGEAITAVGTTAVIEAAYAEGVVGIAT